MKLLRLHVENFGTLQNYDLKPDAGLNILYQKNGWGKSTLAVFIKAMLYGLPATSRRSLDENERKKYTPWQGGAYGGSLEFETARGRFRVERFFAAKESGDSFALYDLSTNKPSNAYSQALGEELFGIDADGFERSTYLSQRALVGGKDNNSISAKLGNLLDDVGDIGNYDTAMAALDKRRKYYVMTGNRGAIADLEAERMAKQAELERCRRVEEAMRAQEAELAECTAQLQALQKAAEENHARLEKAGLARERAALVESKDKMQKELSELNAQRERNDAFFRENLPTSEELDENRRLYDSIRNASMRLNTIPAQPADAETLNRLRSEFAAGIPSAKDLERMEQENETLREIRARREALQSTNDRDMLSRRFVSGTPTQAQMDTAFQALSRAETMQKTIDGFSQKEPPQKNSSALTPIAVLFLTLGIALVVCSFLPPLAPVAMLFLGGGAAGAVLGIVLWIAASHSRAQKRRQQQAMQEKIREWQEQKEKELQSVRALLANYRMPTDDLSRSLTELTLLCAQYREDQQKQRRVQEEINALERRRAECTERLQVWLSPFLGTLPAKTDYRADLERLRQDCALFQRLETAERRRLDERSAAETKLQSLKNALLPFLRRYDPKSEWKAGECLDRIGDRLSERNRLLDSIARKNEELRVFLAEKKLNGAVEVVDVGEFDRLSDEQRTLQARTADLQRRYATLKSGLERLSADADRIPELEEQLKQLKARIDEAKANAATIANTAKFLEEAKNALSTRYLDGMQASFQGFLSALSGKNTPDSVMDTSFEVRLREGGQTRTLESFSRGWRDAVEFCVRLSLTDALYADGEKPFLLLDDPFVNLDDERLAAARNLLDVLAKKYQILYLVCHRERI